MIRHGDLVKSVANVGVRKDGLGIVLSAVIDGEVIVMWTGPRQTEPTLKAYTWNAANGWLIAV